MKQKVMKALKRIESAQNSTYKEWHKLLRRKSREKAGLYLIEGPHLVGEALKEPGVVRTLIFDESKAYKEWDEYDIPKIQLTDSLFQKLSTTETPQGVLAVCRLQSVAPPETAKRFLLIDRVQDPGNLGTLIRTADAAGMDAVYLGAGTVDLYNQKTLRSAQGSHFHLPVVQQPLEQVLEDLKKKGIPIIGTSLNGQRLEDIEGPMASAFALIVGNEGEGVHPDILAMTDMNVKIPIFGRAESLNVAVAAGILMYRLRGI